MKNVIVTGASGNLGQAVVKKFLAENYFVSGTVSPSNKTKLNIDDKNFENNVVDLIDEASAGKYTEQFIFSHGKIDAAILTAGGFDMGNIAESGINEIEKQIELNFKTAYHIARPVFMQMMKQGSGKIFMIGSKPGLDMKNSKGMVAYGLSKSLIFRLAELMNAEAKGTNVITHVIVPSTIDTPANRKNMPDADFSKWVTPEAIADVIYFFCNDEASVVREPVIKIYGNS
jgi:NAD(P)-dependent dehydrogenase (short-subunit alcohol dehydrogenase family)